MATLPTIVQGNSFALAIPLKVYVIGEGEVVLVDYTPDEGDSITVQLRGSRRVYSYTPTTEGNVATIALAGNELAGIYDTVVTIIKDDDTHLRAFKSGQLAIVESVDDMTEGELADGINAGAVYLDPQIFIRGEQGEDGRGIVNITKTATSGLVDTYTITYTDGTTSTFTVTNGADGEDGQDGADGVGIASITEQTSSASGGVNVVTVTLTDGTTSSFTVRNGVDGQTPDMSQYALKSDLATKADLNGNGNEDFAVASLNASNVVFGGYATISGAAPTIQVSNTIGGSTVQFPYDRSGTVALTSDIPDVSGFAEKAFIVTVTEGAQPDTYVTDKTVAEIVSAVSAGRLCLLKYGDMIYQLAGDYAGYPVFAGASISGNEWLFWIVEPEGVFCSGIEWQPKLESGTTIKTINNTSLLDSGNLALATASQLANYCPIIEDTRSSAVANITGVAPFSSLVDGQRIILHFNYKDYGNTTLQLTLADNTTTAAIPIYRRYHNGLAQLNPTYLGVVAGSYVAMVYDANNTRWVCLDDSTTYINMSQNYIDASGTAQCVITGKILRDNFYLKSEGDARYLPTLVEVQTTGDVTQALESGKFYKFGSLDSLTITLTAAAAGIAQYGGKFTASANWSALALPATVDEAAGNDTVASGKTYEFNILDNVIVLKEV